MPLRISTAARNAAANAIADLLDAGPAAATAQIYTGPQPLSPATAASGTLLATVQLADPAFGNAGNGTAAATDPAPVTAINDGTAGWFRVCDSTGLAIWDGQVTGTGGGGQLELSATTLTAGVTVDITAMTITMPAA